jgi:Aspartyl protease
MKQLFLAVPLLLFLSSLAQDDEASDDLSLAEYNQVESALTQGDERRLPACVDRVCRDDLRHLIKASALRIQWKLADSLDEAYRCTALSRNHHDLTYYTCARLVVVDAEGLYGLYGKWVNLGLLVDATKRVVADHLWGFTGSWSSTPAAKEAAPWNGLRLGKEVMLKDSSIALVPLMGEGIVNRSYVFDNQRLSDIKVALAYPSVHVKMNGVDLIMMIDTGSQSTGLYSSAVKKVGLTMLNGLESDSTDGAGFSRAEKIGMADSIELGNVRINNKYVYVINDVIHLPDDGIIGFDVLDKLGSFALTKDALIINACPPHPCNDDFTVSSDLYSGINGIIVGGSIFNDAPVVAVLDTGNSVGAVTATWKLVKRSNLSVSNRHLGYWGGPGGAPSPMNEGDIKGTLNYLGKEYSGTIPVGVSYPRGDIDLNIGMPFFYGNDLYINFDTKKMCMIRRS